MFIGLIRSIIFKDYFIYLIFVREIKLKINELSNL